MEFIRKDNFLHFFLFFLLTHYIILQNSHIRVSAKNFASASQYSIGGIDQYSIISNALLGYKTAAAQPQHFQVFELVTQRYLIVLATNSNCKLFCGKKLCNSPGMRDQLGDNKFSKPIALNYGLYPARTT
jgi:hypothetical protein